MGKRLLGIACLVLVTLVASAQWSNPADDLPAFHTAAPAKPPAPILSGDELTGPYFTHPYQVVSYRMASSISAVLYQLPCYCRCDRALGHKSLRSCFEGTHGAACSTCMREGVFAFQQTKLGKTPGQIRAAIERGEWQDVDLTQASL